MNCRQLFSRYLFERGPAPGLWATTLARDSSEKGRHCRHRSGPSLPSVMPWFRGAKSTSWRCLMSRALAGLNNLNVGPWYLARECAVFTRRFVDDRNMRGNPLCVDKPIEVGCRTISSVGSKPFNKINNLRNTALLLGTFLGTVLMVQYGPDILLATPRIRSVGGVRCVRRLIADGCLQMLSLRQE